MSRVLRRRQAAEDIAEIWDFIAADNLAAADRWVDHLDQQFSLLARQPMMGRDRQELAPGIRSFPFGRYVIFSCRWRMGSMSCACCTRPWISRPGSILTASLDERGFIPLYEYPIATMSRRPP